MEAGKIADHADLAAVDDWSRWFHARFSAGWAPAESGKWSTWSGEPRGVANYFLLDITKPNAAGVLSEPLGICSAGDELIINSRMWHEHFPEWDEADEQIAENVKRRVEEWFGVAFRVAIFFGGAKWKGTGILQAGDTLANRLEEFRADFAKYSSIDRAEIRGPWFCDDEVFAVTSTGVQFQTQS